MFTYLPSFLHTYINTSRYEPTFLPTNLLQDHEPVLMGETENVVHHEFVTSEVFGNKKKECDSNWIS